MNIPWVLEELRARRRRFLLKTTPPDQLAEGIQTVANKEKPVERSL
jgi:DNA-binding NarL/FixJ family response regulator